MRSRMGMMATPAGRVGRRVAGLVLAGALVMLACAIRAWTLA